MPHEGYEIALQRIKIAANEKKTGLILSNLELTELPPELFELTDLQDLNLSYNKLTRIPGSIGGFNRLRELELNDNNIETLPDTIGNLTNLKKISATRNGITSLPKEIGNLIRLEQLYLGGNNLTGLPETVAKLVELRTLFLWGNNFSLIPEVIRGLVKLNHLDFSDTQITGIPEWLGDLAALVVLDLARNRIVNIPETLGNLTNLQTLSLYDNQIAAIPAALGNLTKLNYLYLQNNPDLGLPAELLDSIYPDAAEDRKPASPADIIEYCKRININGRSLNEAKLILVGKGAVGKSSLVERLIYDKFEKGKAKTEGINIERWQLNIKGDDIRLNVWDFGGQEIMHATHQFFLTERSLYLLVLNGREGNEDSEADYWLKLIQSFGANSPVIIVLNKISEHAFDLNRSGLKEKYPNIKAFIRTDCEDEIGITELYDTILRETDALEELRVKFPGEWFSIKDALASMKRNYLSFEQYRELCAEHDVKVPRHQELLAKYLNQLGIVLNYNDDPRLKDTHVLNPHWVTNGIYKILNSSKLEKQEGVIRLSEISEILEEKDYPTNMCRFIFDLMKKFYLCFTFPGDDSHYLIPELLPKNQPEAAKEFIPAQCLNFQYHYTVLPEGILPRFITRTHYLSEGQSRWRTGVILKFENCRALVKADIADKKVSISIDGENPESRRRLLAVVRSDFERIHNEIKNLNPLEMVPLPEQPDVMVLYKDLEVRDKNGVSDFTQVVGEEVKTFVVKDLLNDVDVPKYKGKENEREEVTVFFSYAHKDESFKNELETHLKILQRQKLIRTWSDREIPPGEKWGTEIDQRLEKAEIILLLISANFLASDYCYDIEMKRALEREQKGEAVVIPIILKDCNWQKALFGHIQALPKDAVPVALWPDKDEAWTFVSKGIEKKAIELRAPAD